MCECETVVALTCGLPGSGKSTLCRRLKECGALGDVEIVNYDELVEAGPDWKTRRTEVLDGVMEKLRKADGGRKVFLIDDTMHLRSMRYAWFQAVRELATEGRRVGFACLHVTASLHCCLERNSRRSGTARIDEEMIRKMEQRFEAPNSDMFAWEKNCLTVVSAASHVEAICDFIKSVECVAPRERVDSSLVEAARSENLKSVVHQADIVLRNAVGLIMKAAAPIERKAIATELARKKTMILDSIRTGCLTVDISRVESVGALLHDSFFDVLH